MLVWFITAIAALCQLTYSVHGSVSLDTCEQRGTCGHAVHNFAEISPPNPPPPELSQTVKHHDRSECDRWAKQGECASNSKYMLQACAASCDAFGPKDTFSDSAACLSWANSGECDTNPSFMFEQCAFSCASVGARKKAYAERCPTLNATDALLPGALTPIFKRVVSDFPELSPRLLSQSPPIAVFDNFASPEEVEAFIRAGRGKFKRSQVLDVDKKGGVEHSIRTSSNTWCDTKDCLDDEHVRAVTERVTAVTGVPHTNSEFVQLLEYKACASNVSSDCQFYKRHHDYIDADLHRQQGVRIFTLFIYLTNVTEGGETVFFTEPNLAVKPQAGRAVLWSQVQEDKPHVQDPRTEHEARPVLQGTKLAANFWLHQHDFKSPHAVGCTQD